MTRTRVAILISGSGSNMVALVKSMQSPEHPGQPALVLSNRPGAAGLQKARDLGVPAVCIDHTRHADRHSFDRAMMAELKDHGIGLIACAGFMRIMTEGFVAEWTARMLNIHPSILPLFKGLNTHAQALAEGVAVHGCTVHEIAPQLDSGRILGQAVVAVDPDDTEESLARRVLEREHVLYPRVVESFLTDADAIRRSPIAML